MASGHVHDNVIMIMIIIIIAKPDGGWKSKRSVHNFGASPDIYKLIYAGNHSGNHRLLQSLLDHFNFATLRTQAFTVCQGL